MKKLLLANMVIALLLGVPVLAVAATTTASSSNPSLVARTAQGVIRSIDLGRRSAIISGFLYDFGPPTIPVPVTLLNANPGSVHMLHPGMKVEVKYKELGTSRATVSITQLPNSANVDY